VIDIKGIVTNKAQEAQSDGMASRQSPSFRRRKKCNKIKQQKKKKVKTKKQKQKLQYSYFIYIHNHICLL